ncbi:histidine kinase [Dactylosporangium sp. AC04546]|uniref:sensor histidine kinase n=1 Tax=Dactylosporangium sp. AC04546 TaxID=2862460 RepID=UPI001EDE9E7E|nr:ATP-binding protein [Dactylosporangium sp. AC04546]WVK87745.1 histidine kinase [Dactylosporangium sp. AC04546]
MHPSVARAALGRAVLLGRAAVTIVAAATGLRLVPDPRPALLVAGLVAATTAAGVHLLSRDPQVVLRVPAILALDSLVVVAVLVLSDGGVAYYCAAAGASALAGVLLGLRALAVAAVHAAAGYAVAAAVLVPADPTLAGFVLTFPVTCVLAAAGGAAATAALTRSVELSVEVVAAAQRTAAADERARLARELHDSVAKTLRGVSFAALALPQSLRRHPDLAERLAATVCDGAAAAAREARDLVDGLRLDRPDEDFAATVTAICSRWSSRTGVPVDVAAGLAQPADPPVAVRYELSRILQESLDNAARHAAARRITVRLSGGPGGLRLLVRDDGRGFAVPADLLDLRAADRYGIVGMAERARVVSGELRVVSAPGSGTTVEVLVPAWRA